jgi:eukaryotic-like serine/threonine-protein kinase
VGARAIIEEESPQRIGRYELVAELASGGMASILLARMLGPHGFDRPVVIKRILPHLAREPSFVGMFLDEARIVAGIVHPNVVHVQELGVDGTELYLVMEYLEGESLAGLFKRLTLHRELISPRLAAHIVAQACAGLHAAHELTDADGYCINLVHRDVSPHNLFITYAGQVKVIDFGIATAADRITRTETGVIKGKHEYMSPEQCKGRPLDRRSDIFPLGAMLYELLAGKRLFKRSNQLTSLLAITQESVPALSTVRPGVDRQLEAICMRALARQSDDRFATAADMRLALLAAIGQLGAAADLDAELATLMRRLFPERIEEKREMLQHVRAGSSISYVPRGEVDLSVDIPIVVEVAANDVATEAAGKPSFPPQTTVEGGRKRSRWLTKAAIIGGGLLLVAVIAGSRQRGAVAHAPSSVSPTVQPAPLPPQASADKPSPPPPAAATEAVVHIATTPPSAHVFVGGSDMGATPVDVRLPRGRDAVALEIRKTGYATVAEKVVPDEDQRLVLTLSPASGSHHSTASDTAKNIPAAPTRAPPPAAPDGFSRFE